MSEHAKPEEAEPIAVVELRASERVNARLSYVYEYPDMPGLKPVGEYIRISLRKKDELQELFLERSSMRRAVLDDGHYVKWSFIDPDHTASKIDKPRPALDALLAKLDAGEIHGMATATVDRVGRRRRVGEDVAERWERNPSLYWLCDDDEIDLRTEGGRAAFRDAIDKATGEAAVMAKRQRKRHKQALAKGKAVTTTRPYGWTGKGFLEVEETEAKLIQEAAAEVMAGRSTHPLADRWNEAGYRTVKGGRWTPDAIREILRSPRVAGYRARCVAEYGGSTRSVRPTLALKADGTPVKLAEKAPLTLDEWRTVEALYAARAAMRKSAPSGKVKYFMSGVLFCQCGTRMGGGYRGANNGAHVYLCPAHRGCGKVQVNGPKTDTLFMELVRTKLRSTPVESVAPAPWPNQAKVDAQDALRAEYWRMKEAKEIDDETWQSLNASVLIVMSGLRKERTAWYAAQPSPRSGSAELLARWDTELSPTERRDIVRQVFAAVKVTRDPEVLRAEWSVDRFELPED